MKLKDQVCRLDLAKRLEELGVKLESSFVWVRGFPDRIEFRTETTVKEYAAVRITPAFTVAELGEMLAAHRQGFMPAYNSNHDHGWYHRFFDGPTIHEDTEADARAKMLIYLLENQLITL